MESDREFIDAIASLGGRGGWVEGLAQHNMKVAIIFPDGIANNDPAVERLRQRRTQLLALVKRRDNGPAIIGV